MTIIVNVGEHSTDPIVRGIANEARKCVFRKRKEDIWGELERLFECLRTTFFFIFAFIVLALAYSFGKKNSGLDCVIEANIFNHTKHFDLENDQLRNQVIAY